MENVYPFADREIIEAQAREWLIRLDGDDALSPGETAALREWAGRSPAHREELQRLSAFWSDANILTELAIPLHNVGRTSVRHDTGRNQGSTPGFFSRILTGLLAFKRPGVALAVGILGIVVAVSTLIFPQSRHAANGIYATAIGELRVQTLADGSVVHINTDSQIQVDYGPSVRKIRLLRGEAHFKVTRDRDRPFEVYAGKGMVKAVGTAFSVRLGEQDIKVTVSEGLVDLATVLEAPEPEQNAKPAGRSGPNPAPQPPPGPKLAKVGSLGRGESAVFGAPPPGEQHRKAGSTESAIQVESLPEQELTRRLAWRQGYLVFEGNPLSEVIDEVNRYTPVVIEITDPALRQLKIGGRFKVGELEALYDVLEASFGIQVSRVDDQHIQLRPAQG